MYRKYKKRWRGKFWENIYLWVWVCVGGARYCMAWCMHCPNDRFNNIRASPVYGLTKDTQGNLNLACFKTRYSILSLLDGYSLYIARRWSIAIVWILKLWQFFSIVSEIIKYRISIISNNLPLLPRGWMLTIKNMLVVQLFEIIDVRNLASAYYCKEMLYKSWQKLFSLAI